MTRREVTAGEHLLSFLFYRFFNFQWKVNDTEKYDVPF